MIKSIEKWVPHLTKYTYVQGRQSVLKSGRSEWGGKRNFRVAPKNALLKGYFCPKQGLSALNFRGGAEKVVVHMHWLTGYFGALAYVDSYTN